MSYIFGENKMLFPLLSFNACTASFSFKNLHAFAQARPVHAYPKFALLNYVWGSNRSKHCI